MTATTRRSRLASGWALNTALGLLSVLLATGYVVSCSDSDNHDADDDISVPPPPAPDAASADANIKAAWVEIGDRNEGIARVATSYNGCPLIVIDGVAERMDLRVAAATVPLRTTVLPAAESKPSAFPVATCETLLPASAKSATVGSRTLALPKASPQRIVVLADTGCRMKKSTNSWQACSNAAEYPFAKIAASAAAMKPDLVLHVGDYHYRENECPPDIAGCQGSPWGYGWDTWDADFFAPGAPLLAAAPWVLARGNHEECARAGQGWYRYLDTEPYEADRSCDKPEDDEFANYSYPYGVMVGSDTQLILFDSARVGTAALATTSPQFVKYKEEFQKVTALAAKPGVNSIFVNHHPILGFAPLAGAAPQPGNPALQSVMTTLNAKAYYPPGVKTAIHGHVHDFQAINFSSDHPATIVSGNGGDSVDVNFADPFPSSATPAPDVTVGSITHTNTFGFLVMDRVPGGSNWSYKAYNVNGSLLATCTQNGSKLSCDKTGFIAP